MNNRKLLTWTLTLIAILLFGVSGMSAQNLLKFSIADFDVDPFDLSAKNKQYEKYDGNGDRYAIIKVSTNNPDDNLNEYVFNFGNMKHIVEEHNGVLWLYVQRNAKLVTITRKGYAPINKYDLHTTIESGKNYVMSLTSEQKKVYTQMVQFVVNPANSKAVIMVKSAKDGAQEELFGNIGSSGSVAKNLEYGTYTYKVLADNYHMAEGRFTLNDKSRTFIENVTLKPNYSDITLTVDADAVIYVNGVKKGIRQWTGALKAGNYQVECRQTNHKPSSQYLQVVENDNRTITLAAPEPILGTVAITSQPLGADISIDGKPYGQTPKNLDIIIGEHTLTISKEGYQSETSIFELREESIEQIDMTLGRMTTTLIESSPSGAKLYLDGVFKSTTPFTYAGEVGEHKLKLMADGYRPIEKTVYFGKAPKMTISLHKQLIKPKDFYVELGMGLGASMNATVALGAHLSNFNMEAYYSFGFTKSSLYWNDEDYYIKPDKSTYSAPVMVGAKVGYGFIIGTRFKVTPQVGYKFVKIIEDNETILPYMHCSCLTINARAYFAITPMLGISVTPEYAIGIAKSDGYKLLSDNFSKIKNLAEGFNARVAFVITF